MLRVISGVLFVLLAFTAQAGSQPKFSIIPVLTPPTEITINQTVNAAYQITNNTLLLRTLTMVPITGVTQLTNLPGVCPSPFVLNTGQSCILVLEITGNAIGTGVTTGPEICKTLLSDNKTPDRFLCSQPNLADMLNVRVV